MSLGGGAVPYRLGGWLRQANTWVLIAFLALTGWVVDSMRQVLAMHGYTAGPAAYAAHFWYAVPMAIAILVLTRLRRRERLLGVAAYDQTGALLEQHGSPTPAALNDRGVLAALRSTTESALQGVVLPSGVTVFFLRQAGRNLVLSFSGPVPVAEVRAAAQGLCATTAGPPDVDLMAGLEPEVAGLVATVLAAPLQRRLLEFFRDHSQMAIESEDLAHLVQAEREDVDCELKCLAQHGLLRYQHVCDRTFYSLSREPEVAARLEGVFAWRRCQLRLRLSPFHRTEMSPFHRAECPLNNAVSRRWRPPLRASALAAGPVGRPAASP